MRSTLLPALMGVLVATAGSAWAQNQNGSSDGGYVYVPSNGSSAATIYNTGKDALVTPQIAGRNAPSYVSPSSKNKSAADPYLFGGGADVSSEQYRAAQAMREQQAQQAQQQYLNDMQKNGGTPSGAEEFQKRMSQYNPLAEEEEQKPKKRRVVYNQRNNESAIGIPPRLFNPDQR